MAKPKTLKNKKNYNKRFTNKGKNNKFRHTKKIYKKKRHTTLKHKKIQRGGDEPEKESELKAFKENYNKLEEYLHDDEEKQIIYLLDIPFRVYLQYQYNPASNSERPTHDLTNGLLEKSLAQDIDKLREADKILKKVQAEVQAEALALAAAKGLPPARPTAR